MASIELPGFAAKLRILYAYADLKQASLARAIGRSEATLSEWINGTPLREAGHVPEEGLALLSKLLVDRLGGLISTEKARRFWLGSVSDFAKAFMASTEGTFLDLLASVERSPSITFLPEGIGDLQIVNFGQRGNSAFQTAYLGDTFALRVRGQPGAHVVVIVESNVGRHLGIPQEDFDGRIGANGTLRLPEEGCWQFDPPPGRHRFLVFGMERDAPTGLAAIAGLERPLGPEDIDLLVLDLTDKKATHRWFWDALTINVIASRPEAVAGLIP